MRRHTDERSFVCDEPGCDYKATTKSYLTAHTRTHNDERPFACVEPDCDFKTLTKGGLTNHIRSHTGERPFKVSKKSSESSLKRRRTNEEPYFDITSAQCGDITARNKRKYVEDFVGKCVSL